MRDPQALGEVAGDVDLEATREDDLAVAHHTRLQDRIAEPERNDELRRARLRNDGRRRRIVGATVRRKAECDEEPRGHDGARDDPRDDPDPTGECAHRGA